MKLATFGRKRQEGSLRLGALLDENSILDLSSAAAFCLQEIIQVKDPLQVAARYIPPDMISFLDQGEEALKLAARTVEAIRAWQQTEKANPAGVRGEPLVFPLTEIALQAPIPRPGKIIAMGINFYDHAEENKVPLPKFPTAFLKASSAVIGPGAPVPYPRPTEQLDYEIELAIVIGKEGKDISRERAFEYIAGYTILNDLSARDIQMREMEKRFLLLGKSLDGMAPMGPCLVTRDEIADPQNLAIELWVNNETEPRQKSSTNQMIFKIPDLIAYWSQMTLEPGDIITSGTPSGVAAFRKPDPLAWFLKPGDIVEARIEGLGVLRNSIV